MEKIFLVIILALCITLVIQRIHIGALNTLNQRYHDKMEELIQYNDAQRAIANHKQHVINQLKSDMSSFVQAWANDPRIDF